MKYESFAKSRLRKIISFILLLGLGLVGGALTFSFLLIAPFSFLFRISVVLFVLLAVPLMVFRLVSFRVALVLFSGLVVGFLAMLISFAIKINSEPPVPPEYQLWM